MSFHVPELARDTTHPLFKSSSGDGNNGAFHIESPEPGWRLALLCSDGSEEPNNAEFQWEHVSIHAYAREGKKQRTPTWREMVYVKDLCWDEEDVVMQLHPRRSAYINNHPHTLHLWRPKLLTIPEPPSILVGV